MLETEKTGIWMRLVYLQQQHFAASSMLADCTLGACDKAPTAQRRRTAKLKNLGKCIPEADNEVIEGAALRYERATSRTKQREERATRYEAAAVMTPSLVLIRDASQEAAAATPARWGALVELERAVEKLDRGLRTLDAVMQAWAPHNQAAAFRLSSELVVKGTQGMQWVQ